MERYEWIAEQVRELGNELIEAASKEGETDPTLEAVLDDTGRTLRATALSMLELLSDHDSSGLYAEWRSRHRDRLIDREERAKRIEDAYGDVDDDEARREAAPLHEVLLEEYGDPEHETVETYWTLRKVREPRAVVCVAALAVDELRQHGWAARGRPGP